MAKKKEPVNERVQRGLITLRLVRASGESKVDFYPDSDEPERISDQIKEKIEFWQLEPGCSIHIAKKPS